MVAPPARGHLIHPHHASPRRSGPPSGGPADAAALMADATWTNGRFETLVGRA